jgi:diacylglycerol kinase family enzyme
MLGIPLTLEDSLASLVTGASRAIDFGIVEWDDSQGGGRRPFINVAGIGLDARSSMLAVKLKPYLGNLCYTVAPALSVWTWKRRTATIEVEDATGESTGWTGDFLLASVANGKWVGGGIKISPDAQIDDGLLDLCLIRATSPVRALVILPKAVKGRHTGLPEVDARPFRSMIIGVSRESPIHLDGEPCTPNATRARFAVSSRRLVVVAPERS